MTELEKLQQTITEAKAKIDKLIEEAKQPKKWKWSYKAYETYLVSTTEINYTYIGNSKTHLEHGRYRRTKEQAEASLLRNKRANRLEALVREIGGLYEWKIGEGNFHIYFDGIDWCIGSTPTLDLPGTVYMSEDTATEVCRLLNEGLFSLDGEL